MPRRSYSRQFIEVELFPFLSILACTIGSLILIIIVLTTQLYTSQKEVTIVARADKETGKNRGKSPRYIECRNNGIIIHPDGKLVPIKNLENQNSPLKTLLNEVKEKRDREYLIVAVRPDGIEVFKKVRDLIETQGIDIGYEPIDKDWKLKVEQ
jgi:hypothetical protein